MRRKTIFVVLLISAMLILPRFVLPPILEYYVADYLEQEYGGQVRVTISTWLGWELVIGRLRAITIKWEDVVVNDLRIASIWLSGYNVAVDVSALLKHQQLIYLGAERLDGIVTVNEVDLNRFFWQQLDPEQHWQIDLTTDYAVLSGTYSLWQMDWHLSLVGEFSIAKPAQILFIPKEFLVMETRVPALLLELVSEYYTLIIDLRSLPIPIQLDWIELTEQQIVLYGRGI